MVPLFQVEIGRSFAYIGIGEGAATWAVTNWGNMACSCLCSCCHCGQLCGCIIGVDLSVVDAINLVRALVALGKISCGNTSSLSCQGKQTISLSLSSSGQSVLLFMLLLLVFVGSVLSKDLFLVDSINLRRASMVLGPLEMSCVGTDCLSCQGK